MKKINQLNKIEVRDELHLYVEMDTLLTGTIDEVSNKILELKYRLKKECPAFVNNSKNFNDYIRFELKYTCYYESPEIKIIGIRLETDEEFEVRLNKSENARLAGIASAKKRKQETKTKELALLEKLKKKYEKS